MKCQVRVSVQNIANNHVHFQRVLDADDSVLIPYDKIIDTLLFLYQGLKVKVVVEKDIY